MFTIEMDFDEIAINILDDSGSYEDLQALLYDDTIYFKQWNEETEQFNVIILTPRMLEEFLESMNQGEGSYVFR